MRYSPSAPRTVRGVLIFLLTTGAGALTGCSPANDGVGGAGGVGGSGGVGGTGGAPSSSGSGGVDSGAASGGAPGNGTGGSAGQGGGAGGTGGTGGTVVEPPGVTDGGTPPVDAPAMPIAGQRILLNMLSTGYVHTSEVPASRVLRDKLTALGFTVQIAEDAALFSDAGLAPFKVVVMVQASGEPAGPAAGVDALIRWIRAGGGLVGFHGATILSYPTNGPYVQMMGGKFVSHPGGVRRASCDSVGTHPSIAKLAKPFVITDEIYVHTGLNPMNQVVLTCPADGGGAAVPISWYRNEGTGRVFYTALGNGGELWTATSALVNDHVVPGILWAAGQ